MISRPILRPRRADKPPTVHDNRRPALLEVRRVSKQFPGVRALRDVDLQLNSGEVLALVGENGAGKSTLMKVLAGVEQADSGEIHVNGNRVVIDSVRASLSRGIALIHQELNLADNLEVGANIFLGREPCRFGCIDRRRIHNEAKQALQRIGLDVSPETPLADLTIGRQQMVEIARALSVNARILIMDEPTSSLSSRETQQLFQVVKDLRAKGVSIIYISHRLREVQELADRVMILRDGENAGVLTRDEVSHDRMVKLMVGREVSQFYARRAHSAGDVMLQVKGLVTSARPRHSLDFHVRRGEIVGVAGLVGAGRTEMLQTLFGIEPPLKGRVEVAEVSVDLSNPVSAIRAGLALVPEDRKQFGLIVEMVVRENISLAGLRANSRLLGLNDAAREKRIALEMIQKLRIRTPNENQISRHLSGGNQQKVVLAKWLSLRPQVLLLDEPTRGIDVGAKQEIYGLMEELAEDGLAVLFASSEMEEILGMSDRVLVMHEGRISGELDRSDMCEESVMRLATGAAA